MAKSQILVDSDAFVGLFYTDDGHHKRATSIVQKIHKQRQELVATNYVIAETGTVLSNKSGQALARLFLDAIEVFPTIHIDEQLHKQSIELFKKQNKKGTSMVDCSNVVVMQKFDLPAIFSFDKFYRKFDLKMIK